MGSPWESKTYVKNALRLLSRNHINDGFQIFSKRYWGCLYSHERKYHMCLVGLLNPCELQQCWECIFLKHYSHVNTKWALKKNSINSCLSNCIFKIFTYSYLPNIRGGPIKRGGWKISQNEINGEGVKCS